MSVNILITIIVISILVILIIVGLIFYFTFYISKKYRKYWDNINEFLKEPYVDTLTTLRTIDISLKKQEENKIRDLATHSIEIENDEDLKNIIEAKELFANKQLDMEKMINNIKSVSRDLFSSIKNRKFREAKRNIKKIENTKKEIEKIQVFVNQESKNHIDQQKELENSIYQANKIARNVKNFLNDWIKKYKDNEAFVMSIKGKINEIDDIGIELGEYTKNQKYAEGLKVLRKYRRELWNVCLFGNRIDGFVKAIEIDSIKNIRRIQEVCETIKNNLESDLSYLEIQKYFDNAQFQIEDARKNMYSLNVINTMTAINNFYGILLDLNVIINNEITAFNFINNKKMEELEYYNKNIAKKIIEIKNEYEKAYLIDKNYAENLMKENIEKMDEIVKNVNSLKVKYELEFEKKEISNTSKQYKYKTFIYLIKQFNEIYYQTKKSIDDFYYEGISQRLRYNRLKKIFLKCNGTIKEKRIILSLEDKELINKIENKKAAIDKEIIKNKNNENKIEKEVNHFYELILKFIDVVVKKILIAKMFVLVNEQNSYLRINNKDLDLKMIEAEEEFMEGKYNQSLMLIVSSLKREIN